MILGDIRDEEALSDCIAGARYVYHLAGIADIGEAARSPRVTVEHNIIGSTAVLQSCLQAKVERMLFASTLYVYSQQGSFYRVSKQAVELLIEAYHENFGLEYTILRYGSLYGPRAQEWNGLKRYVTQAVREGRIHYPGTGEERREYIHVIDAARLSVEALAPDYANQCLTLTGTQILNSGELLRMIQEILGGKVEITFSPEQSNPEHYELTPYRFTPRKARKIVPNVFVDIGQGILDLVEEVYLENGPKNTND
jgi:UDP-glucose 4-epimerase